MSALLLIVALLFAGQAQRTPESQPSAPQVYTNNCAFCHGLTAQGGARGGPDLTQSALARSDQNGKQLGDFLKVGRPEKGMPAFHLPDSQVTLIAAFIHLQIAMGTSHIRSEAEVLVGDADSGKRFFHGEGRCFECHKESGDLKGIGAKYPPAVLQGRLVLPIGDGGYPGFPSQEPPRIHATITRQDGSSLSGLLVYLSDYAISVIDASGERHTLARQGYLPMIYLKDPLEAHFDRQLSLTDTQMHDLTAYLATLR